MTNKSKKTPIDSERSKVLRDNAFSEVSRYEPDRVRVIREKHGEKAAKRASTAIALTEWRKQVKRRNG